MQSSVYNNPAFAQGLAGLVNSFIGDPVKTAQAELYASEALLNNQTAQYREAMDVGLDGDIASMMIRALQAGPDYSRYAPSIGQAWYDATSGRMARGPVSGGRSSGRAGSGGEKDPSPLDFRTVNALRGAFDDMDVSADVAASILAEAEMLKAQNGWTDAQTESYVLKNLDREEIVTNPPGTWITRMFGMDDGIPDATEPGAVTGLVPYTPSGAGDTGTTGTTSAQPNANTAAIIAEARDAIARGANRDAVMSRLRDMGIDPGGL